MMYLSPRTSHSHMWEIALTRALDCYSRAPSALRRYILRRLLVIQIIVYSRRSIVRINLGTVAPYRYVVGWAHFTQR